MAKVLHFLDKVVSEFGLIPLIDRYAETLLLPVDKFVRYYAADGLLQNIFEHSISGFYRFGNTHGQLYELVVEKWNARF